MTSQKQPTQHWSAQKPLCEQLQQVGGEAPESAGNAKWVHNRLREPYCRENIPESSENRFLQHPQQTHPIAR